MITAKPFTRSACAIANSLDIVGDKWSLLVVRDGAREFAGTHSDQHSCGSSKKRLEGAGIIVSTPYQQRPMRYAYTLTPKGSALGDVLLAFVRWGKQHMPGTVALNQGPASGGSAASAANSRRTRTRRAG
jgi:DNA-binding HxlR family transcriptional regulator